MKDDITTINDLKALVRGFVNERDWAKYHNPKDLAISICLESNELLEHFQWKSEEEAKRIPKSKIEEELADLLIYSMALANVLDIDLSKSVKRKLKRNSKKYPVEKYFGKARL